MAQSDQLGFIYMNVLGPYFDETCKISDGFVVLKVGMTASLGVRLPDSFDAAKSLGLPTGWPTCATKDMSIHELSFTDNESKSALPYVSVQREDARRIVSARVMPKTRSLHDTVCAVGEVLGDVNEAVCAVGEVLSDANEAALAADVTTTKDHLQNLIEAARKAADAADTAASASRSAYWYAEDALEEVKKHLKAETKKRGLTRATCEAEQALKIASKAARNAGDNAADAKKEADGAAYEADLLTSEESGSASDSDFAKSSNRTKKAKTVVEVAKATVKAASAAKATADATDEVIEAVLEVHTVLREPLRVVETYVRDLWSKTSDAKKLDEDVKSLPWLSSWGLRLPHECRGDSGKLGALTETVVVRWDTVSQVRKAGRELGFEKWTLSALEKAITKASADAPGEVKEWPTVSIVELNLLKVIKAEVERCRSKLRSSPQNDDQQQAVVDCVKAMANQLGCDGEE